MTLNPIIYEINTRVWLKNFGQNATLKDVPESVILDLKHKGINYIWLMGIWKNCKNIINDCCFSNELINSYNKSLKDWKKEDVIGSPYSIDDYEPDESIGNVEELMEFKKLLNKNEIYLILDFVSNHFGCDTKYLESNPELFLKADLELYNKDSFTYFKYRNQDDMIFAHGRDPLLPAWTDTVQLNFFNNDTREFLYNILTKISNLCDGVRCDMAMLPLNNVFNNTWIGLINKYGYIKPNLEFWKHAIEVVKHKNKNFIFIAEAYWDLEWHLQQLGFDFTYDKRLNERLTYNDIEGIYAHLKADDDYQLRSIRFLENHDEIRSVTRFGKYRSLAAAVVICTIYGMKFFYDGQFEGKKTRLPVQLGRAPFERVSNTVSNFYNKLLNIVNDEIFKEGKWKLIRSIPSSSGNSSYENFLSWIWTYKNRSALVVVNYSEQISQCRILLNIHNKYDNIVIKDVLNNELYDRSVKELGSEGLYVELKSYSSHIFMWKTED